MSAAVFSTVIPGLPGGPLVTDYPIYINLVPKGQTRQRPGIKARSPRRPVQHGSGNPNSSAEGEIAYIVSGAEGRQASFHFSSDWDSVSVGVPVDEVTWQAADGSGPGNMSGVSNELAENRIAWSDPAKRKRMIYIAGDLMGRVAARLGMATPEYHWTFNFAARDRHRCPDFLLFRNPETKPVYEKQWHASKANELQRMARAVAPAPAKSTPVVLTRGNLVKVLEALNVRQVAGTTSGILATLEAATAGTVVDGPVVANGYTWYRLDTATADGWVVADWLTKTGEGVPPAPKPRPSPVPALLGTDLRKNDTAEGITSDDNGTDFVFVADVIEVTEPDGLDVFVWADRSTVLRHLAKGDRFVGAWLFRYGADDKEEYFYLECAPDWGRIPYQGTRRVADAPLIPGAEHVAS